jgi:uncharacterized surface protein with fasciclin (FAS1) repeats
MRTKLIALLLGIVLSTAPALGALAADIADTIAANPALSTFASAVKAAGLSDQLKATGPFTVFAPTDEAFKRLPPAALANLMKPNNHEQLVKLVSFHIVPSRFSAKDMDGKMFKVRTVVGKEVEVDADDPGEGIRINKAKIVVQDISADNGVIHQINRVLLP